MTYLCMNTIFSETMQETETKISQFFFKVGHIEIWSAIVNKVFGSYFI